MNWLDIVVVFILVGVTGLESIRGFGRSLMDALCVYGALWLANFCLPFAAGAVHLQSAPAANECCIYTILLLLFGVAALGAAQFLHQITLMDAGMFDRLFSMGTGFAVGMMAAHGFVRIVSMGLAGDSGGAMLVVSSFMGNEMLSFTTYHSIINSLTAVPSLHRDLPN